MTSNKPWDKPWSMEEIIENSDKWNLAGDVALLNTLKSFAENLISRSTEINNNLSNLTDNVAETSLQLNIAQNEFQSLRNSQFIESRVYEDDETLPQLENDNKIEDKAEPNRTEDIKLAALKGLEVLDRYFDKIEVSVSDSEDDDIDLPNYILRPKDLYIDRPLPYIIGSEEWHKNWHVGLEDSSSDSESEKESDKFSESDSESDLPIIQDRSQIKGTSDTSSELDFSQKTDPKLLISSKQDLFHSSDSDDQNSVPVQAPISTKNFAAELAAKLGNVIEQEYTEPEINKRPIQTKPQYGDLFFDEPPPLDDNKGLFSGGRGLFDDDDDDQYTTPVESKIGDSSKVQKKINSGLFAEDSSDDEMFTTKETVQSSKPPPPLFTEEPPVLEERKKPVGGVSIFGGANLFDKKLLRRQPSSDDEEIEETKRKEEKPNKKIDLFTDGDLFETTPKEEKSTNKTKKVNLFDSDEEPQQTIKPETEETKPKEAKKTSFFEDDDDLFKDDLFSTSSKKKFTSGLFDDIDDQSDDLFSNQIDKPKPARDLFEDLMAIPDNRNSINVDTTKEKNVAVNASETSENLFDTNDSLFGTFENNETEAPKPKPRMSLFDSPPPEPDDLFGGGFSFKNEQIEEEDPLKNTISKTTSGIFDDMKPVEESKKIEDSKKKATTSLFDSSLSDDQDDLFGGKTNKTVPEVPQKSVFASSTPEDTSTAKILPNARLFDPSPPPDDDWDVKSEPVSDENDSITIDHEEVIGQRSNLFADEPPSLDLSHNNTKITTITEKFEKEPEITKTVSNSPGKLKHNLNINVGALMPGYAPPKRGDLQRSKSLGSTEEVTDSNKTSFDATDNVEVLQSVTKDRARVPLNRRPSTRRGRKAALQSRSSDFKLEQEIEEVSKYKADSSPPSLAPDLLKSEDLFGSKSKSDLFSEDDDEDDMFSSKKVPVQPTKVLKKSLFDDEDNDEDDDIFKSFGVVKKQESKLATEKKILKVSSVKRLENTKPDDDPLSALLK